VSLYKNQEGKVKTDFKHGAQEKPKQVKIVDKFLVVCFNKNKFSVAFLGEKA